jgi:dienelactone hydrolase
MWIGLALAVPSLLFIILHLVAPAAAMDAYWTEPAYEKYPLKGPEAAVGLVIWNHGLNGKLSQYQFAPPPLMLGLAARGWDVIKLDRNPTWENSWGNAGRRHVVRNLEEIAAARKKGYRRIIVAGQSYGGAIALAAADEAADLWAVVAAAPGTGQEKTADGLITDKWSATIAEMTYDQLRETNKTRLVAIFPANDELIGIPRGAQARAILAAKHMPFLLVDETAPVHGHHAAYGAAFSPYASCIASFLDPASEPAPAEFRCRHDEVAAFDRALHEAAPNAATGSAQRWFGYFDTGGQEVAIFLRDGAEGTVVDYAWGSGLLAGYKPGLSTVPVQRKGEALSFRLKNGALVETAPTPDGGLHLTFAREGHGTLTADLLRVGP